MLKLRKRFASAAVTLLVLLSYSVTATASDWVYVGGTSGTYNFVDLATIKTIPNGRVSAWVEALPIAAVSKYESQHKKELTNAAAIRYISGYESRFLQIPSLRKRYTQGELKNANAQIDIYEIIANKGAINAEREYEYGFACRGGLISVLEAMGHSPDGNTTMYHPRHATWLAPPPYTNGTWLSLLVCRATAGSGR